MVNNCSEWHAPKREQTKMSELCICCLDSASLTAPLTHTALAVDSWCLVCPGPPTSPVFLTHLLLSHGLKILSPDFVLTSQTLQCDCLLDLIPISLWVSHAAKGLTSFSPYLLEYEVILVSHLPWERHWCPRQLTSSCNINDPLYELYVVAETRRGDPKHGTMCCRPKLL